MKTVQILPENLQRQQEPPANMPSASNHPSPNTVYKRKSRATEISDDVILYYKALLEEHNVFIRQNSTTTYRIL